MANPTKLELPFAAPIPRGNEVLWLRIQQIEVQRAAEIVVDLTGGALYCEAKLHFLFDQPAVVEDPLVRGRQFGWSVAAELRGRAVATVTTTAVEAPSRTTLWVDPAPVAPYR